MLVAGKQANLRISDSNVGYKTNNFRNVNISYSTIRISYHK